jgi:heme exporter protein D
MISLAASTGTALTGNRKGITFFQMLRDVLVASLNRGQFPMAMMGLIVIVAICRMPPTDLSRLIFRILDTAELHKYGGYALSMVVTIAWSIHSKRQRRESTAEIRRLSDRNNRIQDIDFDRRIKSDRRRR